MVRKIARSKSATDPTGAPSTPRIGAGGPTPESAMPTAGGSPSSSSTATATTTFSASAFPGDSSGSNPNANGAGKNAMQSWWESISRARARIQILAGLLPTSQSPATAIASLADSDRPARSLLDSPAAYAAVSEALSAPLSGSGDDPLCQWLYETFQSSDSDLRLVTLSFLPLLSGLYLSRVVSSSAGAGDLPSLAGFEAVLLALYAAEVKARAGKPLLVSVPDLSFPSLYHSPRPQSTFSRHPSPPAASAAARPPSVGVLSPPLEPQVAVKSTKRACIVGAALDVYYKNITLMPARSKIDLCEFVSAWAGQDCSCRFEFDGGDQNPSSFYSSSMSSTSSSLQIRNFTEDDGEIAGAAEKIEGMRICESHDGGHCSGEEEGGGNPSKRGSRVPLPWELLQPVLRILGHCLLAPLNPQEVRDAAAMAVRCVYARASHDLLPQAILAARSLIQLDKNAKKMEKSLSIPGSASNPNTPCKPRKPEVLLVSN